MPPREQFDRELKALRDDVIKMGLLVNNQLDVALQALNTLDPALAKQAIDMDQEVNAARFSIEDNCFLLIVRQQPNARDLRTIFAAINVIVDLERAGDQAKGIAHTVPHLTKVPKGLRPELTQMGELVRKMLQECIQAYGDDNVELAQRVSGQAADLDKLYAEVMDDIVNAFAKTTNEKKVSKTFGALRAAQHLERIGDLTTNIAERIVYIVTGNLQEMKTHQDDTAD